MKKEISLPCCFSENVAESKQTRIFANLPSVWRIQRKPIFNYYLPYLSLRVAMTVTTNSGSYSVAIDDQNDKRK